MLPLVEWLAYKSEPQSRGEGHEVKGLGVVKVVKDHPQAPGLTRAPTLSITSGWFCHIRNRPVTVRGYCDEQAVV
ncbi:hypothetical protein [Streptomyces lasiicapitis]|uniref:hypothetical protein n=1 Tax=Streptomyces lasiicapitis TaxID=1923961 RepID=UPI003683270D